MDGARYFREIAYAGSRLPWRLNSWTDHLDSVNLRSNWQYLFYLEGLTDGSGLRIGSLAELKWDPLIVAPLSWYYYTSSDPNHPPLGPFWTIVSALSMASKKPRVFGCESAMSPTPFEVTAERSRPDHDMLAHGCKAFAGLRRFILHVITLLTIIGQGSVTP